MTKKFFCLLLIFSCSKICAKDLQLSLNLLKCKLLALAQSLTKNEPKRLYDGIYDNTSSFGDYVVTFLNSNKLKTEVYNKDVGIFDQIPALGQYESTGYNFRKRLFLVEVSSEQISSLVPEEIKTRISSIEHIYYHIMGTGIVFDETKDSPDHSYNIIYHGFLSRYYKSNTLQQFRQYVSMGIFNPDGIDRTYATTDSIPINTLNQLDVHFHDHCFSPNNARIKIEQGREISTFWSLAITTDNKRACVVYQVLFNTENAETKFTNLFNNDFEKLLNEMSKLSFTNTNDTNAIKQFATNLQSMVQTLKK